MPTGHRSAEAQTGVRQRPTNVRQGYWSARLHGKPPGKWAGGGFQLPARGAL